MWRYSNFFMLLVFIVISAPVLAGAEMMSGTVLTIDREQGTFVLRTDSEQDIQVQSTISPLPARMMPGKRFRIWGNYATDSNNFTATDIRGPGKNRHNDPTGVRDRIGNGKYCRKSSDSGTIDDNGAHGRQGKRRNYGNGPTYGQGDSSK